MRGYVCKGYARVGDANILVTLGEVIEGEGKVSFCVSVNTTCAFLIAENYILGVDFRVIVRYAADRNYFSASLLNFRHKRSC